MFAIDAVFGSQGKRLLDVLPSGGTYAQLAFLDGPTSHMKIGATDMWARGLTMKGFRGASQLEQLDEIERTELLDRLVGMFNAGRLRMPSGVLRLPRIEWVPEDMLETERRLTAAVQAARTRSAGSAVKQILITSGV